MERTAKILAPVDDSQLRQSITFEINDTPTEKELTVGTNVEYGPYQEYGTGIYAKDGLGRLTPWKYKDVGGKWHYTNGNRPHPYLRPAFAQHKDKAVDDIRTELRKEWER